MTSAVIYPHPDGVQINDRNGVTYATEAKILGPCTVVSWPDPVGDEEAKFWIETDHEVVPLPDPNRMIRGRES